MLLPLLGQQHRAVPSPGRGDQAHQRHPSPVDELADFIRYLTLASTKYLLDASGTISS